MTFKNIVLRFVLIGFLAGIISFICLNYLWGYIYTKVDYRYTLPFILMLFILGISSCLFSIFKVDQINRRLSLFLGTAILIPIGFISYDIAQLIFPSKINGGAVSIFIDVFISHFFTSMFMYVIVCIIMTKAKKPKISFFHFCSVSVVCLLTTIIHFMLGFLFGGRIIIQPTQELFVFLNTLVPFSISIMNCYFFARLQDDKLVALNKIV